MAHPHGDRPLRPPDDKLLALDEVLGARPRRDARRLENGRHDLGRLGRGSLTAGRGRRCVARRAFPLGWDAVDVMAGGEVEPRVLDGRHRHVCVVESVDDLVKLWTRGGAARPAGAHELLDGGGDAGG